MDESLEQLSRNLGRNLGALRERRGLSQASLAKLAGIPRSTLTHIETGQGNPSLANLARIAAALGVTIEELLSRPRAQVKLVRAASVRSQKRANGAATVYKLLPDPVPGMEIDRMEIQPGARMGGIPHIANTKEYLTCISGRVMIHLASESITLEPGDVLAFPGDQPHSYSNPGAKAALCVSVVVLAPFS